MLIYILGAALSAFIAFPLRKERFREYSYGAVSLSYQYSKKRLIFSMLPMLLISALRFGIGTDFSYRYSTYQYIFYAIRDGIRTETEIGYYLLNRLSLLFTDSMVGLYVITSLVFCVFIYISIFEQSSNPSFSIFLLLSTGLYFASMNTTRQLMATAIFCYSLKFIKQQKIGHYFLCILFAVALHSSAIILIPMYFLFRSKAQPWKALLVILATAVLLPVLYRILTSITQLTRFSVHLQGSNADSEMHAMTFAVSFALIAFLLVFYKKLKDNFNYRMFLYGMTLVIAAALLATQFGIAVRIAEYFKYLTVLFLPDVVNTIKNPNYRFAITGAIVVMYIIYMVITFSIMGNHGVVPYVSVFNVL